MTPIKCRKLPKKERIDKSINSKKKPRTILAGGVKEKRGRVEFWFELRGARVCMATSHGGIYPTTTGFSFELVSPHCTAASQPVRKKGSVQIRRCKLLYDPTSLHRTRLYRRSVCAPRSLPHVRCPWCPLHPAWRHLPVRAEATCGGAPLAQGRYCAPRACNIGNEMPTRSSWMRPPPPHTGSCSRRTGVEAPGIPHPHRTECVPRRWRDG